MRAKATTKHFEPTAFAYTPGQGSTVSFDVSSTARKGHVRLTFDEKMYAPMSSGLADRLRVLMEGFLNRMITPVTLAQISEEATTLLVQAHEAGELFRESERHLLVDEEYRVFYEEPFKMFDRC